MMNMEKEKGVVKERPNFGNKQVRELSEIEWGKQYRDNWNGGSSIIIPLHISSIHKGVIWAKTLLSDELQPIRERFLADMG